MGNILSIYPHDYQGYSHYVKILPYRDVEAVFYYLCHCEFRCYKILLDPFRPCFDEMIATPEQFLNCGDWYEYNGDCDTLRDILIRFDEGGPVKKLSVYRLMQQLRDGVGLRRARTMTEGMIDSMGDLVSHIRSYNPLEYLVAWVSQQPLRLAQPRIEYDPSMTFHGSDVS
eukprot:TRINITY_DN2171_c0_g1_i1.p1 TRINITY_DN2171_c0_g1~~TRINITY_DN2171_c0_g1_i1.p1  ORF type:complete len:171 (+),score=5.12 TRINITY_DN2171_c0_g1_i1:205-717(+)